MAAPRRPPAAPPGPTAPGRKLKVTVESALYHTPTATVKFTLRTYLPTAHDDPATAAAAARLGAGFRAILQSYRGHRWFSGKDKLPASDNDSPAFETVAAVGGHTVVYPTAGAALAGKAGSVLLTFFHGTASFVSFLEASMSADGLLYVPPPANLTTVLQVAGRQLPRRIRLLSPPVAWVFDTSLAETVLKRAGPFATCAIRPTLTAMGTVDDTALEAVVTLHADQRLPTELTLCSQAGADVATVKIHAVMVPGAAAPLPRHAGASPAAGTTPPPAGAAPPGGAVPAAVPRAPPGATSAVQTPVAAANGSAPPLAHVLLPAALPLSGLDALSPHEWPPLPAPQPAPRPAWPPVALPPTMPGAPFGAAPPASCDGGSGAASAPAGAAAPDRAGPALQPPRPAPLTASGAAPPAAASPATTAAAAAGGVDLLLAEAPAAAAAIVPAADGAAAVAAQAAPPPPTAVDAALAPSPSAAAIVTTLANAEAAHPVAMAADPPVTTLVIAAAPAARRSRSPPSVADCIAAMEGFLARDTRATRGALSRRFRALAVDGGATALAAALEECVAVRYGRLGLRGVPLPPALATAFAHHLPHNHILGAELYAAAEAGDVAVLLGQFDADLDLNGVDCLKACATELLSTSAGQLVPRLPGAVVVDAEEAAAAASLESLAAATPSSITAAQIAFVLPLVVPRIQELLSTPAAAGAGLAVPTAPVAASAVAVAAPGPPAAGLADECRAAVQHLAAGHPTAADHVARRRAVSAALDRMVATDGVTEPEFLTVLGDCLRIRLAHMDFHGQPLPASLAAAIVAREIRQLRAYPDGIDLLRDLVVDDVLQLNVEIYLSRFVARAYAAARAAKANELRVARGASPLPLPTAASDDDDDDAPAADDEDSMAAAALLAAEGGVLARWQTVESDPPADVVLAVIGLAAEAAAQAARGDDRMHDSYSALGKRDAAGSAPDGAAARARRKPRNNGSSGGAGGGGSDGGAAGAGSACPSPPPHAA